MKPLPRFLLSFCSDGPAHFREFVIHLGRPRLAIEAGAVAGDPSKVRYVLAGWLESEQAFIASESFAGRNPSATLAKVLREATEFHVAEMEANR